MKLRAIIAQDLSAGREVLDGARPRALSIREPIPKGQRAGALQDASARLITAFAFVSMAFTCGIQTASAATNAIEFKRDDNRGQLQVLIGGKEAFAYCYGTNVDLPHFFPLRSPSGKSMTVQQTEPYPHHRSFWFADTVQLEGQRQASFYNAFYSGTGDKKNPQPPFRDHIRQVAFTSQRGGAGDAELGMNLLWEMDDGKIPVLDETRQIRIVALGAGEYFLDLQFALTANYGDVTFRSDSVHYAWPFIRLNQEFNSTAGGLLVNSEGQTGQTNTNMKVARWVDFSRTGIPEAEGLAMFSHPSNEQPHSWLTRDYGCIGPRRVDAKSGKPFTLMRGETIRTRAGVLIHAGDVKSGQVAERYQAYADGKL
jgi:hypothetical protein